MRPPDVDNLDDMSSDVDDMSSEIDDISYNAMQEAAFI